MLEQRKARLQAEGRDPGTDQTIEALESVLNSQKFGWLVTVDVGSPTGESVRDMAIEASLKDFYEMVYVPHSQATHNTWHHLSFFNLRPSKEALHRHHLVPYVGHPPESIYAFLDTAKMVQNVFDAYDAAFGLKGKFEDRHDWLGNQFAAISDEIKGAAGNEDLGPSDKAESGPKS